MKVYSFQIIAIAILFSLLSGCSGNPAVPNNSQDVTGTARVSDTVNSTHTCLGYSILEFDRESYEVIITPLRSAELHMNLVSILNATMGVAAVGVPAEHDPPNGIFTFDITLTHPFGDKTQFAGFDVKGILMAPGSYNLGAAVLSDVGETRLLNADGYSRWWNPVEFTAPGMFGYTEGALATSTASSLTATVNPYKYFADILFPISSLASVVNEPLDSDLGRGVFTAGSVNTRRYTIQFEMDPGPKILYGYAIDCSWNTPSPNPPSEVPDDFPMDANQAEAYRIGIQEVLNTTYYDSDSGTGGGFLRLLISVFDWQGQEAGNIADEVDGVRIYATDLLPDGVSAVFSEETAVKAQYTAELTDLENINSAGETLVVCRVGSTDGSTYDQVGMPAPDAPLSAFHAVTIDVTDPDCIADTNNDFMEALDLDLENPTVDQMCAPSDYIDFFKITIPSGNLVSGTMSLLCDAEPTKFGLYDSAETLIQEISVTNGVATIDFGCCDVVQGIYYLRVFTQTSGQAFLYAIEPNISLIDVTPTDPVDVTPPDLYLNPWKIQVKDDILVTISDSGGHLWVYDISDPSDMILLWHDSGWLYGMPAMNYPYMYAAEKVDVDDYRVHLLDFTDPSNPVFTEDIKTYTKPVRYLLTEPGYLYIAHDATSEIHLDIFDISTPASPVIVDGMTLLDKPENMEFVPDATGPDYWLAVMYKDTVEFWNVGVKGSVTGPESYFWLSNTIGDIAPAENYLYVTRIHDSSGFPVLTVLSVTTSGVAPVIGLNLPVDYSDIEINGDVAWISDKTGVVHLAPVDISTPSAPVLGSDVAMFQAAINDMDCEDGVLYTACDRAGIIAYDISSIPGFAIADREVGIAFPRHPVINKNHLFVSETKYPYCVVKSIDLSDPSTASVVSEVMLPDNVYRMAACGDYLICESTFKVLLIDCSDPKNLVYEGEVSISGDGSKLAIHGNAFYLAYSGLIETWDLSTWPAITLVDTDPILGDIPDIEIWNSMMYLIDDGDIKVFSIINPLNPNLVDIYAPLADAKNLDIVGNYLYISTAGSLEIADISTPSAPVFVSSIPHPDTPHGDYIAVENMFAILQPYTTAPPTVFNVLPPETPSMVGPLYGTEYQTKPNHVLINDGYYYEQKPSQGIRIWDLY